MGFNNLMKFNISGSLMIKSLLEMCATRSFLGISNSNLGSVNSSILNINNIKSVLNYFSSFILILKSLHFLHQNLLGFGLSIYSVINFSFTHSLQHCLSQPEQSR